MLARIPFAARCGRACAEGGLAIDADRRSGRGILTGLVPEPRTPGGGRMTELVVCSGKGGTGKTSVVAGLAALAEDFVLADCDVDAANLHLVMNPVVETDHALHRRPLGPDPTRGLRGLRRVPDPVPVRRPSTGPRRRGGTSTFRGRTRCSAKGAASASASAPPKPSIFPSRRCGEWCLSRTPFGPLVHAALDVGAENSGKLVSLVREQARLAGRAVGTGSDPGGWAPGHRLPRDRRPDRRRSHPAGDRAQPVGPARPADGSWTWPTISRCRPWSASTSTT